MVSWALVLGISAMVSRRPLRNLASFLACGLSAVTVYYLLKAYWGVGYPSRSHGFADHLASGGWSRWSLVVAAGSIPAALIGTAMRRLLAAERRP